MNKEPDTRKHNTLSIAGFAVGILAQFIGLLGFTGLIGTALSALGLWYAGRNGDKKWLAVIGLILSLVSTALCLLEIYASTF